MSFKRKIALAASTAALLGMAGTAQAAFEGRDATGAASATCTATGAGKCTYFYDTTLGITILNNWNLGPPGTWSASAEPDSAQAWAASAGLAASGLTGWVLPTGDGSMVAGALNQYLSIWNSVGGSFAGLTGQFDGVQPGSYWSSSVLTPVPSFKWEFNPLNEVYGPLQSNEGSSSDRFAVAVFSGDVAVSAVPEPSAYAMMMLGLSAVMVAVRRRSR